MAKKDYLFRYLTIIKKLRNAGEATFGEISDYLKRESELTDHPVSISIRTFQRDLREILELFGIEILYDFSRKVYYIAWDEHDDMNDRMIESIDFINTMRMADDIGRFMYFEKRKARGTNHFNGLLQAIRNRVVLELSHRKFVEEAPVMRLVAPYSLKESGGRWYLVARDMADKRVKTFGLDRIHGFQNTPKRFDPPANLDLDSLFRYSFGIINREGEEPEDILLQFDAEQGQYVKSYPIHESQTVVTDNEWKLVVRLRLWITYDLVQEILSYGNRVTVLAPDSLRTEVVSIAESLVERYTKKGKTK